MSYFNLTRKNKFILIASLLLLITLSGLFFWNNSMHQSVRVSDEPIQNEGNTIIIDESGHSSSSSASKSKPLFASKSSEEKLKETSIMLLILFLIGIVIYAISSRDNFKKKLK